MRTKIEGSINSFVMGIAELYEPILATSLEDALFEKIVEDILRKKDALVDELCLFTEEKPLEEAPSTPSPEVVKEPIKDLWNGTHDLPRSISSPGESFSGKDFESMASSSIESLNRPNTSSAGFVDEEVDIKPHNLGMSVAEEKRVALGMPVKRVAPSIHVDHTGSTEELPNIPRPVPKGVANRGVTKEDKESLISAETKSILRRIQDVCVPHQMSPDRALRTISCGILSVVAAYLPMDHPEEAPRYESVKGLWSALQNLIGTLKKVQSNLGRYRELSKLQKDLNDVITQLMVETSQYSLPDEVPVEVKEENPTEDVVNENGE